MGNVFSLMHEEFRYFGYDPKTFRLLLAAGLNLAKVIDNQYCGLTAPQAAQQSGSTPWMEDTKFFMEHPFQKLENLCRQFIARFCIVENEEILPPIIRDILNFEI